MWQQIHETLASGDHARGAILSVAIDAQGRDRVRTYVDQAGTTFPTLVDETGILSRLVGFKVVPNGLLVDESGIVRFTKFGGFTVDDGPTRAMVEHWLQDGGVIGQTAADATETLDSEALGLFEEGLAAIRRGDRESAARAWRRAARKDPANWLIRKQLWALENPERFYSGDIDFAWQKEQIARGV